VQLESLQLRALARFACSKVVPPETIEDVLNASILENMAIIAESGTSAVITSTSNAGQSTTQTVIPGSWGPADIVSALELLLEVVEALLAAGVPPEELCDEPLKTLVAPQRQVPKSYNAMIR
jgi:2-keto-3-deoxy-6-phosphogluconate aldolase